MMREREGTEAVRTPEKKSRISWRCESELQMSPKKKRGKYSLYNL